MWTFDYPVGKVWIGSNAAQVANHIHIAIASCHVKSCLPRLTETIKNLKHSYLLLFVQILLSSANADDRLKNRYISFNFMTDVRA